MHADRFAEFTTEKGPFASVYYEDSHASEDAAQIAELTWRSIREQLEQLEAPPPVLDNIERALAEAPTAIGRGGRAIVANGDKVLVHERLIRPPLRTEVRVSELPYLLPLVEHGASGRPYLVVAVDHTGGDLTVYDQQGTALDEETVAGEGYPIHKASGAQTPGYGDPEPRVEEQRHRNIAALADRLTELADEHRCEPVFVIGEIRSRSDLVEALPQRIKEVSMQLQTGSRGEGSDRERTGEHIEQALAQQRLTEMDETAERYRAGAGTGLAVEGLSEVTAALRQRRVDMLILGDLGDVTVLVGDDPSLVAADSGALSEMGSGSERIHRADEALPFAAVTSGAAMLRMDERLTPADGVAALLRY
ncbi:Rv2629 family ribosome hibernation factor [Rhodococcus sp. SJ-2]|nr:hypothetical protein [Rhodococcus sp. (in: high G+C Gram-positive bacteria)]